jgi:hypothetical protein
MCPCDWYMQQYFIFTFVPMTGYQEEQKVAEDSMEGIIFHFAKVFQTFIVNTEANSSPQNYQQRLPTTSSRDQSNCELNQSNGTMEHAHRKMSIVQEPIAQKRRRIA